jgi:hypothetical protein
MAKAGDIVLVSSSAGDIIPCIHVRLLKRIIVKPSKGNRMDWPGYSGWEATPIFQEEIDFLRKEWNIPFLEIEKDITFVYDDNIIKRVYKPKPNQKIIREIKRQKKKKRKGNKRRRIVRNSGKKNGK